MYRSNHAYHNAASHSASGVYVINNTPTAVANNSSAAHAIMTTCIQLQMLIINIKYLDRKRPYQSDKSSHEVPASKSDKPYY